MDPSKKDLVARLAEARAHRDKHFREYLTIEGLAHILRISPTTIRKYKREGTLPFTRLEPDGIIPQNQRHLYTVEHARRIYNKLYLSK